jgi:competence ComEA-like helix-hairpin-helix protein
MMWKLDFRRATLVWLLSAALVIGLGLHGVQWFRGRAVDYPLTVVENDAALLSLQARADSIFAARTAADSGPLNINTASTAQFESLDGIGPVLARRLVEYREQHGSYSSVDELDNVSGIGPKRLAAIRARCFVDSL